MRSTIVFVSVLLMLVSTGCTDRYKSKEELFKEGVKVLNAHNPGGAVVSFKKALEKDQNFFEARLQLAKAYLELGKFDSAENELQKVVRQAPASREVRIELGKVRLMKERPDEAIKEVSPLTTGASPDAEAVEVAGWAYAMKGDYEASVALLKKILSDKGRGAQASRTLSKVYLKMGRYEDARSQVLYSLKKDPSDKGALAILGEVQTKTKEIDAALGTYDRILGADPSDLGASTKKTLLLIGKGDYDQALSQAEKVVKRYPVRPEGYLLKGVISYYRKNLVDAAALLEKSVSLGAIPAAYYYLGLTHYAKREPEQAIVDLRKAMDLNHSFAEAAILSSAIMLKLNMPQEAVKEIQKVLAKDDKNAVAHNVLGAAYIANGMYGEGIQEIDRAIELDPKAVLFRLQKGQIELDAGRFKDAETSLKAAVSVEPGVLQSRIALASYYMKLGQHDKALDVLQQGLKGQKTDAVYYDLMAAALMGQGKQSEAVKCLEKAKQSNPTDGLAYFKLATLYFQAGDTNTAIRELQSLVAKDPANPAAPLAIAGMLDSRGDKKGALDYSLKAKATGKGEGYNGLARYYVKENRADDALAVIDEAIRRYPSDAAARELKGAALLLKKKYDDAIDAFEDAERLRSGIGLPLIINTYLTMGKPEKAIDRLDRELARDPDRLDFMVEKSRVYMAAGRKQDAFSNARGIVSLKPGSPAGYITLAGLYRQDGQPDKAIEVLKSAPADKGIGVSMMLGGLYASKKDYASALAQYNKASGMKPDYAPAIFQRGYALEMMGRKREARADYQKVLRVSRDHLGAMNNLAYLNAEDGVSLAEALQLAQRAAMLSPGSASVQDTLGFVLLKNGKAGESLKALTKAAGIDPKNPSVHYHLALAYKEQGSRAQAVDCLQKALGMGEFPESGQARTLLAKLKGGARG